MSTKKLIALPLGAAAAFLLTTCAPVEPPNKGPDNPTPTPPGEQLIKLPTPTPEPKGPKGRIEAAIDNVRRRELETTNGFWTIFHGTLGLGTSVMLRNPETGAHVNAVDYIAGGGELRGLGFFPTKHGLDVKMGEIGISQGHQDQFIAEMGQWNMPADKKFTVFGKD